ncbi:MAG TPA: hypothetical protein VK083_01700 [Nocardia sp.]|uniref:hypothetical protein n=1 Tax=Nocardia TaxID=1817 RepID=UPI002453EFD2|nr:MULTISPECIES: hypothetical protein [Nocardia]HLS75487.1 hypothetical protein [Nocardia sp.]
MTPSSQDWVPDACTLPTVEQPIRVAEFDSFFAGSVRSAHRPHPTRLDLTLHPGSEDAARDLAARESGCCRFFTFEFPATTADPVMRIGVPGTYVDVLDALEARATAAIN